ncbi:hypothetical protein BT96DRAFT_912599 [Gymnopus androsaceus JB14]|uniref:Uncharacterized protein n=1 Tax=Gymnopus androsaceus JB14 TaxID=1447944 RepID=A0A6A4IN18_9AGAR|nr:hypothetical protein BT96DRAFT_912599 [Gymnopus androsaceus JB14]
MSYYPTQASHRSRRHSPVMYNGSHHSHHGMPQPYAASGSQQYYNQPAYGGNDVVIVPPSHAGSSHGHRPHHYTVAPSTTMYSNADDGRRHHRRSRHHRPHHSHSHSTDHHHLSFGERLRRFFGFGPKHRTYRHKSRNSSWGFLGRSRRRRYMDARTGAEVDRHGRPVYRV